MLSLLSIKHGTHTTGTYLIEEYHRCSVLFEYLDGSNFHTLYPVLTFDDGKTRSSNYMEVVQCTVNKTQLYIETSNVANQLSSGTTMVLHI